MTTKIALVTAPRAVRALRLMSLGFLVAAAGLGVMALLTRPGTFELAPVVAVACVFAAFFAFLPTATHAPERDLSEPTRINPATGLPMIGDGCNLDVGGNTYGTNSTQDLGRFHR